MPWCCVRMRQIQVQALNRSQPMLPMELGYVEGLTHDYVRHGTTTPTHRTLPPDRSLPNASPATTTSSSSGTCATSTQTCPTSRRPPHRRQLRHPQARQDQGLARQTPALPHPLHADLCIMAQPGRALDWNHHPESYPTRLVLQRQRNGQQDQALRRASQCQSPTIDMDRDG